jgi:hypothetical protein
MLKKINCGEMTNKMQSTLEMLWTLTLPQSNPVSVDLKDPTIEFQFQNKKKNGAKFSPIK